MDMQFCAEITTPADIDVQLLIAELNQVLNQITQDSGVSSFDEEAFNPNQDGCLVVYAMQQPVACGVFRFHQPGVCELKRMYAKYAGAGSYLIAQLQQYAQLKGYQRAVLSTRRINQKAVAFYCRHGYEEIAAYGKYVGVSGSICMGKELVDSI